SSVPLASSYSILVFILAGTKLPAPWVVARTPAVVPPGGTPPRRACVGRAAARAGADPPCRSRSAANGTESAARGPDRDPSPLSRPRRWHGTFAPHQRPPTQRRADAAAVSTFDRISSSSLPSSESLPARLAPNKPSSL